MTIADREAFTHTDSRHEPVPPTLRSRVVSRAVAQPVFTIFFVALAVRISAIGVVEHLFDTAVAFPDTYFYETLARQRVTGDTASWPPQYFAFYRENAVFMWPLSFVYWATGSSVFAGRLFVALCGAGTAAFVTASAIRLTSRRWSLLAGGIAALYPSAVLWSSLTLKDAAVWLLIAALVYLATRYCDGPARDLVWLGPCTLVTLTALSFTRLHTAVVALVAVVITVVVRERTRVPRRLALAAVAASLLVALFVPWAAGGGPAGIDVVRSAPALSELRAANAEGARTAFVDPRETTTTSAEPRLIDRITDDLAHLPRGLAVIVLEPLPWSAYRSESMRLAQFEVLGWWMLWALSVYGVISRRHRIRPIVFPAVFAAGITVTYALAEGNLGTAFRHRAELVPMLAILATIGACALAARRRARSVSND